MKLNRSNRIKGGLAGLLIGDALGVPYEFTSPAEIPSPEEIEMNPPKHFHRTYLGVPGGTWSDDGAQALCLLASLLDCGKLDPDDLGRRFVDWNKNGYMAVCGDVFDIGSHTGAVLTAIAEGMPALEAGAINHAHAQGNGSLMRTLPLALWHRGTDEELVLDAHLQSRVTHGNINCQVACAVYCLWARRMLDGVDLPWEDAAQTLKEIYRSRGGGYSAALDEVIWPDDRDGTGKGWVVDALHSARMMVARNQSYEDVVKGAIALGNDTDTTACIAGGIAGIRCGLTGIPNRWIKQLRGQDILMPLHDRLLAGVSNG